MGSAIAAWSVRNDSVYLSWFESADRATNQRKIKGKIASRADYTTLRFHGAGFSAASTDDHRSRAAFPATRQSAFTGISTWGGRNQLNRPEAAIAVN